MSTPFMALRQHPHHAQRLGVFVWVVAITVGATGCHVSSPHLPTDPGQTSEVAPALTALPTLEDTQAQITSAIERVGQQISAIVPAMTWAWRREASRGGCRPPFEQSGGHEVLLANYVSDVPIPEQNWKQAYDIAARAASELGAATVTVFKDAPDDHDVQFSDDTGTTLRVGSQKASLLTGSTGCRLPAK